MTVAVSGNSTDVHKIAVEENTNTISETQSQKAANPMENIPTRMAFKKRNIQSVNAVLGEAKVLSEYSKQKRIESEGSEPAQVLPLSPKKARSRNIASSLIGSGSSGGHSGIIGADDTRVGN